MIRAKQFETDSVTFRTYPTSKTNHKKNLKFRRKIYIKISHLCLILLLNHTVGEQHTLPFKNAGIPQENYILIELQEDN